MEKAVTDILKTQSQEACLYTLSKFQTLLESKKSDLESYTVTVPYQGAGEKEINHASLLNQLIKGVTSISESRPTEAVLFSSLPSAPHSLVSPGNIEHSVRPPFPDYKSIAAKHRASTIDTNFVKTGGSTVCLMDIDDSKGMIVWKRDTDPPYP